MGVPVSKAHAPNAPSGVLFRPFEHLSLYGILSDPQPTRIVHVTNQFGTHNWTLKDGALLMVPAIKDSQGALTLGQHWKCYHAIPQTPAPGNGNIVVNLQDQLQLSQNNPVGVGRYLCNPAEKNFEGPPALPNQHLACYDIPQNPLPSLHTLADQFGPHLADVENPEALCVPSLKFIPEPGAMLSLGSGLMLLGWLGRRRSRGASR